ncbi:MAG: beta strand repeat-containing protein [Aestuariivirga sp.]
MTTTRWQLNNTTGGLWSTAGNWTAGVPDAAGDFVTFDISDPALSGGGAGTRTIDLSGIARTVGFLNLAGDATRNWNIGLSTDTLILQPLGGDAFVSAGSVSGSTFLFNFISATLQFNASVDFFVDPAAQLIVNNITESGGSRGIEKFGTGNLQLLGNSGYTGTTQIHAGGLGIGSGGTTGTIGSGNIIIDAGALLAFVRTDTTTIGNQISGDGFVLAQLGTTTLTGANTFTGGLRVDPGATLIAGSTTAFGTGFIDVDPGGTLDLNGFDLVGYNTGALFDRFVAGGTAGTITSATPFGQDIFVVTPADTVFNGSITGNITLVKSGAGNLYLTGVSNVSQADFISIQGGNVALLGSGSYYAFIETYFSSTFDISGISGTSTTIRGIISQGTLGGMNLGGKELIVDTELGTSNANIISTFGLQDKIVIKQLANFIGNINIGTQYRFANWEDGFDTITIMGNEQANNIIGSRFSDTILGGRDGLGAGDDALNGGLGDDILNGGNGDDKLTGGAGDDIVDGGANTDTASYETTLIPLGQRGVTVSLLLNGIQQNTKSAGLDTLTSIENVTGTINGSDTLTGDANANVLKGLGGNDTLEGGAGGDTLDPGTGTDTVSYASSNAGVTVNIANNTAANGHAAGDTLLVGFDNIIGSNFGDSLSGNNFNNVILGRDGIDNIFAALGNDTVNGGIGNDIIRGGGGADHLTGGLGNDVFYYVSSSEGSDTISDFRNIVGDNDVFRFLGSAFGALPAGALAANRFLADAGGVATTADHHFMYETDTGILRYDADGNGVGAAVIIATVSGAPAITLSDFSIV